MEITMNPVSIQLLQQSGYTIKFKEMLEDYAERLGFKDADKYFEKLNVQGGLYGGANQLVPQGAGGVPAGSPMGQPSPQQGMAAGGQTVPGGQTQPIVS